MSIKPHTKLSETENNSFRVSPHDYQLMAEYIDFLVAMCHKSSVSAGWWNHPTINVPEKLCLIHSEISEAMEGYRKDAQDDHLPHQKMITCELADAIIRICDLAGKLSLPLGSALAEKYHYNQIRADHKLEHRNQPGGKKF